MEKRIQLKTRYHNRRTIDVFSSNCVNILLLVGFNVEPTEQPMKDFCITCNCKNIIGDKNCYKNPENPKCNWSDNDKYTEIFSKLTGNENRKIWFSQNKFSCIEILLHQTKTKYYSISKVSKIFKWWFY